MRIYLALISILFATLIFGNLVILKLYQDLNAEKERLDNTVFVDFVPCYEL